MKGRYKLEDLTLDELNLIIKCAESNVFSLDSDDYLRLKSRVIDLECVLNVVEVYDWDRFYFKVENKSLKIIKRSD